MHELGIAQEILAVVTEHSKGAAVRRVVLEIGKLVRDLAGRDAVLFRPVRRGHRGRGGALEIIETPGRARCRACGEKCCSNGPSAGAAAVAPTWNGWRARN